MPTSLHRLSITSPDQLNFYIDVHCITGAISATSIHAEWDPCLWVVEN